MAAKPIDGKLPARDAGDNPMLTAALQVLRGTGAASPSSGLQISSRP
jgi:hypothetical protein